jgi:hypothetical protein
MSNALSFFSSGTKRRGGKDSEPGRRAPWEREYEFVFGLEMYDAGEKKAFSDTFYQELR